MRELKFRMYDKELSKLVYRSLLPYDNEHPDIEVMQFINSKDMNGVDIYDGDILTGPSGLPFLVKWVDEEMRWGMVAKDRTTHYNINAGILKVIGNIHENPELF
jgi:YopX protein